MKVGYCTKVICNKTYYEIHDKYFVVNETYDMTIVATGVCWVYSPHSNNFCYFYLDNSISNRNQFHDYFYIIKEDRKKKLEKLEETNKHESNM